ncbi:hypothetical protein BDZ89DRAFT_1072131, partial [Hymenopellis radicata]
MTRKDQAHLSMGRGLGTVLRLLYSREGQPEARRINVVACCTEQVGRSCWVEPLSSIYSWGLVSECTWQSAYTSEEISAKAGR